MFVRVPRVTFCFKVRHTQTSPNLCKRFNSSSTSKDQKDNASKHQSRNENKSESDDSDHSYMKRRLEQLEEDAALFDVLFPMRTNADQNAVTNGSTKEASIVDKDERMAKIYSKLEQSKYENQFASEISYTKIPSYADKLSKELAISAPWRSGNGASDVATGLANSSSNAASRSKKADGATAASVLFTLRRNESVSERLTKAREKSLDYSLLKHSEDEKFREMYREKLLGPEQVTRVSFAAATGSIKGMADARIDEARAKGEFDNLPRGKPIEDDYQRSSPYLDRTEYHLNKILKRQDIKLPWIEKQGSVTGQVAKFRHDLKQEWVNKAVHLIDEMHPGRPAEVKMESAKYYSKNYANLKDQAWEDAKRKYFEVSLRHLNDSIRGYNLQAPLPSQIFYLLPDKELQRCYKEAAPEVVLAMKSFLYGEPSQNLARTTATATRTPIYQHKSTSSLGSLFFDMFRKGK